LDRDGGLCHSSEMSSDSWMCESREQARDTDLGLISLETVFKVLGLDEIAWGTDEETRKFKAEPSTF